jgi:hypothetical protein
VWTLVGVTLAYIDGPDVGGEEPEVDFLGTRAIVK